MPQPVTRTLKITYGSFVLDSTGDYYIDGRWTVQKDYDKAALSCVVVVQNETAATFITSCQSIEAAFRIPRQRLKVEVDSTTVFDLHPTGSTGFNAEPSIEKLDDDVATGRSRRYRVTVRCELPADLSGQSGRRLASVTLDQDASKRRRISVAGRYTAVPGGSDSALTQYQNSAAAYRSALITAIGGGGTFDLIQDVATRDDSDKNCDFVFVLQEDLYGPTSATLSHASIRGAAIRFAADQAAPGDAPSGVKRLQRVVVSIDCSVDNDVSTDLEGLWTTEIRPWLISQARTRFGASAVARVGDTPTYDRTANTISATVTLDMVVGGVGVIGLVVSVEVWNLLGNLLVPAYAKSRLAKYEFNGIARRVRTTTVVESRLGLWTTNADGGGFSGGAGGGAAAGGGAGAGPAALGAGGGFNGPIVGDIPATHVGTGPGGSEVIVPGGGDMGFNGPGGAGPGGARPPGAGGGGGGGGAGYRLMETRRSHAQRRLGLEETIDVTDLTTVLVEEWADPVEGGSGGGGVITPDDPPPATPAPVVTTGQG